MGFHFYADDTQLYLSFDSLSGEGQASAVHSIEACVSEIDEWMRLNKLKLNSDMSDILVISSKYRPRPSLDSISISEQVVNSSVSARNLVLIVDDSLSLEEHVNSISKSCYYHIRRIAKIRKYLSEDSTAALVHAFITCRLDNGNALCTAFLNIRFSGYKQSKIVLPALFRASRSMHVLHQSSGNCIGCQWKVVSFLKCYY